MFLVFLLDQIELLKSIKEILVFSANSHANSSYSPHVLPGIQVDVVLSEELPLQVAIACFPDLIEVGQIDPEMEGRAIPDYMVVTMTTIADDPQG
jgi:hypothetical protein